MEKVIKQLNQLKSFFEPMPVGVVILDSAGKIIYVNSRGVELYGQKPQSGLEMPSHSFELKLLKPDGSVFPSEELPASQALIKKERIDAKELLIERPDGSRITVMASASPVLDEQGGVTAVIGVFEDISSIKRAEEALIEANRTVEKDKLILEQVIQQMPAGIILTDASGVVAKNNAAMDIIWRRKMLPVENVDKHEYIAYHKDGREYKPEEWPLTKSLRQGEEVVGQEMVILRGDGTKGTVLVSSAPIKDKTGKIIAGVVVDVDVSEQKQVERINCGRARRSTRNLSRTQTV